MQPPCLLDLQGPLKMATDRWVRHWSRGASNGIGMSGAKTSYRQAPQPILMHTADIHIQLLTLARRSGVCIGNWVEADAARELAAQATPARFSATSTVQDTYRPEVILRHM